MSNGVSTDIFQSDRQNKQQNNLQSMLTVQRRDPEDFLLEAPDRPEMDAERREQLKRLSKISALASGFEGLTNAIGVAASDDYAPSASGISDLGVTAFDELSRMDQNYRSRLQDWRGNVFDTRQSNRKLIREAARRAEEIERENRLRNQNDYRQIANRLISQGEIETGLELARRGGLTTSEINGMAPEGSSGASPTGGRDGNGAPRSGGGISFDPQMANMVEEFYQLRDRISDPSGQPNAALTRELEWLDEQTRPDRYSPTYQRSSRNGNSGRDQYDIRQQRRSAEGNRQAAPPDTTSSDTAEEEPADSRKSVGTRETETEAGGEQTLQENIGQAFSETPEAYFRYFLPTDKFKKQVRDILPAGKDSALQAEFRPLAEDLESAETREEREQVYDEIEALLKDKGYSQAVIDQELAGFRSAKYFAEHPLSSWMPIVDPEDNLNPELLRWKNNAVGSFEDLLYSIASPYEVGEDTLEDRSEAYGEGEFPSVADLSVDPSDLRASLTDEELEAENRQLSDQFRATDNDIERDLLYQKLHLNWSALDLSRDERIDRINALHDTRGAVESDGTTTDEGNGESATISDEALAEAEAEFGNLLEQYARAGDPLEQDHLMVQMERKLSEIGYNRPVIERQLSAIAQQFGVPATEGEGESATDRVSRRRPQLGGPDQEQVSSSENDDMMTRPRDPNPYERLMPSAYESDAESAAGSVRNYSEQELRSIAQVNRELVQQVIDAGGPEEQRRLAGRLIENWQGLGVSQQEIERGLQRLTRRIEESGSD